MSGHFIFSTGFMQGIQMVDLKGQYNQIKPEIDAAIQRVIDSSAFVKGPEVKLFQEELAAYMGVKHAIACANGTDALQLALMALDLKPGDEVITSNFTFIATAEVIALLGLTPVLVDVDPKTFNLDPKAVAAALTPATKAIIPVHLFGQCAPMEELLALAAEHHLYVVEDTAQAIGARYTFSSGESHMAGTMGTIGTTSFFPSKNLGCYGDGGALFTNDDALAARLNALLNHGMEKRYYHDYIGVNSRLDSIQAAILRTKLPYLNAYNAARQKAAKAYTEAFWGVPGLTTPFEGSYTTHVYHQYTLLVADGKRDALKDYLYKAGIPAMVYYPLPLHRQKALLDRIPTKTYPITENLCESVLSLPMHTELSANQLSYITENVLNFFKS